LTKLKVLHITSSLSGGAGLACLKIHQALLDHGIDSTVLTLKAVKGYPNVHRVFPKKKNNVYRVLRRLKLAFLYDRVFMTDTYIEQKRTKKKYETFALSRQGSDFKDYLSQNNFDIVNLHWVARQVDLKGLLSCFRETKIVWTLHDMNPFTAGCTAAMGCELYKTTGCEKCPQLVNKGTDIAKNNFLRKQKILENTSITMVSSSTQLYENAQQSLLTKNKNHELIPLANFRHLDIKSNRNCLKHDFGLSITKTIIGFGAVGINRHNKGLELLLEVFRQLPSSRFQLVIFGSGNIEEYNLKNLDVKYYGEVNDTNHLAMLYKVMDVFVSISQQEAFGQTFMEALCQGTPVIGTNTGAIQDFVNDKNGIILKQRTKKDLKKALSDFKLKNFEREKIALKAKKDFNPEIMITRYVELYKTLIKR